MQVSEITKLVIELRTPSEHPQNSFTYFVSRCDAPVRGPAD